MERKSGGFTSFRKLALIPNYTYEKIYLSSEVLKWNIIINVIHKSPQKYNKPTKPI